MDFAIERRPAILLQRMAMTAGRAHARQKDQAVTDLAHKQSVIEGYRYQARPIRFLGVRAAGPWQVKRYAITTPEAGGDLTASSADAAWRALMAALPADPAQSNGHGVAILTMHAGLQAFWVLVDWWAYGDVLMHRHFRAPVHQPAALLDVSGEGFGPCVWELAVQSHERQAWLDHVLARPGGIDLPGYLRDGLTVTV